MRTVKSYTNVSQRSLLAVHLPIKSLLFSIFLFIIFFLSGIFGFPVIGFYDKLKTKTKIVIIIYIK